MTHDTENPSAPHLGLKASVQQWADAGSVVMSAGTTAFSYNARSELTGSGFSVGTSKDFAFDYDLMGKRTSKMRDFSATTYAAAAANVDVNEYAGITGSDGETGLAYDANGNMTQDGTWHYSYDADEARKRADGESAGFGLAPARPEEAGALRAATKQNRLTAMTRKSPSKISGVADRLEVEYDYLSRRTRKTTYDAATGGNEIADTVFVWSGWSLVSDEARQRGDGQVPCLARRARRTGRPPGGPPRQLDANSSLAQTRSYLWGEGFAPGGAGALLAVKVGGAVYYPVYDPMGNVTGYLNSSGTTVSAYEYNAYGELTNQGNYTSTTFAHGFSTQYTDRETGLVYYGYRYYDPKHGRFINRDPIEEAGGLNLYGFVDNSPTNGWDDRGLCFLPIMISFLVWVDEWGDNGGHYAVVNQWFCAGGPQPGTGPGDHPGGGGGGGGGGGTTKKNKKKKPTKEECDALRSLYPEAFGTTALSLADFQSYQFDINSPNGFIAAGLMSSSLTGDAEAGFLFRSNSDGSTFSAQYYSGNSGPEFGINYGSAKTDANVIGTIHSHELSASAKAKTSIPRAFWSLTENAFSAGDVLSTYNANQTRIHNGSSPIASYLMTPSGTIQLYTGSDPRQQDSGLKHHTFLDKNLDYQVYSEGQVLDPHGLPVEKFKMCIDAGL